MRYISLATHLATTKKYSAFSVDLACAKPLSREAVLPYVGM